MVSCLVFVVRLKIHSFENRMQARRLQQVFAFAALLMLPWPALRPAAQSITFGDLLLLPAILLNIDYVGKIRGWQIPLLASLPLIVLSQVADPDGSIIGVAQAVYIFGVVLPFGWVAFVNFRPRTLITGFLVSLSVSAIVGGLQLGGFVGQVGNQSIWALSGGAIRSAGLSISCSGLCLSLSPVFALLLYVPDYRKRMVFLLVLALGLLVDVFILMMEGMHEGIFIQRVGFSRSALWTIKRFALPAFLVLMFFRARAVLKRPRFRRVSPA